MHATVKAFWQIYNFAEYWYTWLGLIMIAYGLKMSLNHQLASELIYSFFLLLLLQIMIVGFNDLFEHTFRFNFSHFSKT